MREISSDSEVKTKVLGEVECLMRTEQNEVRDLVVDLTDRPRAEVVSFGTEAGILQQQLGLSSVVCGPGAIAQAHQADEFICVNQLSDCLVLLSQLGKQMTS